MKNLILNHSLISLFIAKKSIETGVNFIRSWFNIQWVVGMRYNYGQFLHQQVSKLLLQAFGLSWPFPKTLNFQEVLKLLKQTQLLPKLYSKNWNCHCVFCRLKRNKLFDYAFYRTFFGLARFCEITQGHLPC